jgi:hypothetical protein
MLIRYLPLLFAGLLPIAGVISIAGAAETTATDQSVLTNPSAAPTFAPNPNCTRSTPCENVIGEILRIEESYWVRTADGREIHMRVSADSKMKELPKVGDTVAAQVSSTGDVQAIQKLAHAPDQQVIPAPKKKMEDLR